MSARKFTIPPTSRQWLRRDRLMNHLSRAARKGIVFVSAPGGFGKTVAVAQWLADRRNKVAWLTLDRHDNEPAAFCAALLGAMAEAQKANRKLARLAALADESAEPLEYFLRSVSLALNNEKNYCLVLDDFQVVDNRAILDPLPQIINRLPTNFTILVLSRQEAPEPFSQLIAKDQVASLSVLELKFTPGEVRRLSQQRGMALDEKGAKALCRDTGGWALAVSARIARPPAAEADLEGAEEAGAPYFDHYIARHIWGNWNWEVRDLLLKTVIVQDLDADFCFHMTGRDNCGALLERLHRENAFVSHKGEKRFRLHGVFREWLLAKWAGPEYESERPATLLRAARWFHKRERYFQAAEFYLEAGDYAGVAQVIRDMSRYDSDHLSVERHIAILKALKLRKLPEDLLHNSVDLLAHHAWGRFLSGDAEGFCTLVDLLRRRLETMGEFAPEVERLSLVFSLDFRVPLLEYARSLLEGSPFFTAPADDALPRIARVNSLTQNLPLPHRSMRDFSFLATAGEEAYSLLRAVFGRLLGRDYDLLEACLRAGIHYERGEQVAAMDALRGAEGPRLADANPELGLGVQALWYLLLAGRGEREEAERRAADLEKYLNAREAAFLWPNFRALVYDARIRGGDQAAAREWLESYADDSAGPLYFCRMPQHFTTARALLAEGSVRAALELLERLLRLARDYRRPIGIMEADILRCQALWRQGEVRAAVDALDGAEKIARPLGFVRPFVQDAAHLAPAFRLLALRRGGNGEDGGFIAFLRGSGGGDASPAAASLAADPDLTQRQIEILRRLAEGRNNPQIAVVMDISPNTVKNHLKKIFRALGVGDRREAIAVAEALRLLDRKPVRHDFPRPASPENHPPGGAVMANPSGVTG